MLLLDDEALLEARPLGVVLLRDRGAVSHHLGVEESPYARLALHERGIDQLLGNSAVEVVSGLVELGQASLGRLALPARRLEARQQSRERHVIPLLVAEVLVVLDHDVVVDLTLPWLLLAFSLLKMPQKPFTCVESLCNKQCLLVREK